MRGGVCTGRLWDGLDPAHPGNRNCRTPGSPQGSTLLDSFLHSVALDPAPKLWDLWATSVTFLRTPTEQNSSTASPPSLLGETEARGGSRGAGEGTGVGAEGQYRPPGQ